MQVELAKKTLILQGTKTSNVLNTVLSEIYHLKRDNAIRYTRKNDSIRPFESGGETSLEFFSLKTDCSIFVVSLVPKRCSIRNMYCILWFYFIFFNCIELDIEFFSMKTDCSIFVVSLVPKLCSIRNMYCILWFYFIFF
jgi:hypothetical protein